MITHEEARNKVKSNHNKFYTEGEFTKDMLDYISQQEKKDELLGLYREKSELLVKIANGKYLQDDYMKLLEKIDSLNKELGEMK